MEVSRRHLLYDVWLDDAALLERTAGWREILLRVAEESGATVLACRFHQFTPAGVTGFVLLAESHLSVHTWPEENLAVVDIFTCGPLDAEAMIARLRALLQPRRERVTVVARGQAEFGC